MADDKNIKSALTNASNLTIKPNSKLVFTVDVQPQAEELESLVKSKYEEEPSNGPLSSALKAALAGSEIKGKAPSLAFTENPAPSDNFLGLYKTKRRSLPDSVLKQVRITDHLVAAILRSRGNMMSLYGHLRKDRFDVGIELTIKPEFLNILTTDQYEKVVQRIKRTEQILLNCGHTNGLEHQEMMTISDFFDTQTRNGMTFGRFATEIIYDRTKDPDEDGLYPFHRFRPVDVGTIYRTVRKGENVGNNLRITAIKALEGITGDKINIDLKSLQEDKYAWMQVVDGTPRQAFTHEEMLVFNFFESSDIEHNGYPISPLDTVVSSVTTHISIDAYKKLYFQNGRASKGMLIIRSDEVDQPILDNLKLQFNASINNVSNSFRTPIFGIGKEDEVSWVTMQGEGLGDEFEFMYDQIARNILSAFGMSPDELPGYGHLSKGTNSQTLSECLDLTTKIVVPEGMKDIASILKDESSTVNMVWNGIKWVEAKIFKTSEKQLKETILDNKLAIKTSPDHKFLIVGDSGEPEWRIQSELKLGDFVLTNKNIVKGIGNIPHYNGKQLTLEMMEVLGWMTGDGLLVAPRDRIGAQLILFYHHEKEQDIWNRHYNFMKNFGLNPIQQKKEITKKEQEKIKKRYGFKSVANIRIKNKLYDTSFINWLFSIGFNTSKGGKNIPQFLYTLPESYRQSFLRGLFSADGHINKSTNGSVYLTVADSKIRQEIRELLNTLGISTNNFEGSTKQLIIGQKRKTIATKNKINVKTKREFFRQIGFLQEHKQPKLSWLDRYDLEPLPFSTQIKYVTQLINSSLARKYKRDLYPFVSTNIKKKISVSRLEFLLKQINQELPSWLKDYRCSQVKELIDHKIKVPMADLTVYEDSHAFCANGIIVHNSNNEFKLTAARDSGLRPLILKMETFLNQRLFPIIDPLLSKLCEIRLNGLDANNKEQETTRLQQDMAVHLDYDGVLHQVDKDPVGQMIGGKFPFNERFQLVADKYKNVGELVTNFMGDSSAFVDPMLQYKRDAFWIQYLQLLMQSNPAAAKAYFAPKPYALNFLKMNIEDDLEDDGT